MKRLSLALAVGATLVACAPAANASTVTVANLARSLQCVQHQGWRSLLTNTGRPFPSLALCMNYALRGGTFLPAAAGPCVGGGYADAFRNDTGAPFADEASCIAYARTSALVVLKLSLRSVEPGFFVPSVEAENLQPGSTLNGYAAYSDGTGAFDDGTADADGAYSGSLGLIDETCGFTGGPLDHFTVSATSQAGAAVSRTVPAGAACP